MRDCSNLGGAPKCSNCLNSESFSSGDLIHAATDTKKCPILCRKITYKISNIDYGQ